MNLGPPEEKPSGPPETKLLKPAKTYVFGRKGVALNIYNKKISAPHAEFIVGKFTADEATDPTSRPSLQVGNSHKHFHVDRDGEAHDVNADSTFDLLDGDSVRFGNDVIIKVQWHSVCCYQQAGESSETLDACASLGIHLVHTPNQSITHHITDTFNATPLHALTLVSAGNFVNSKWLREVIRLGNLPLNSDPSNGVSLEQAFKLPDVALAKYRPVFDEHLPSKHKEFNIWQPNEARPNMFARHRFLCVGEGKRDIVSGLRELISRGSGKVDTFDVHKASGWKRTLTREKAKVKETLVLVANHEACEAAVGKDVWAALVKEADIFELQFFDPQDIIQAVLNTDTSLFKLANADDNEPVASSLPDFVPNTHPDESSLAPELEAEAEIPPPRRLTRRVTSRQASQEPTPAAEKAPAPARRVRQSRLQLQQLTRRAQAVLPVIPGLDDASVLLNDSAMAPPPAPADSTKPRSRLKRRVGVDAPANHVETLISNALSSGLESDTGEEPPLKKFKALFEASDPKRSGVESFVQESGAFDDDELMLMASVGSQSQTQTQSETQSGGRRAARSATAGPALIAVQEEEEESQMPNEGSGAIDLRKKRKERSFDGDDVEMAGVEEALNVGTGSSGTGPAAKKRAVENNAVERATSKPPLSVAQAANVKKVLPTTKSTAKKGAAAPAGAATGKPDTDTAFLKAIASTKRGKKTEDDFDRDFNKLKISKNDLRADDTEERPEWELLDTFGDETNLRGNFMVIQDLDVFKIDRDSGPRKRTAGTDPRWGGKPDFKKFKKQNSLVSARKKTIELVISEENDSGLGPGYWKGGNSPTRSEDDFGPTQKRQTQAKRTTRAPTKSNSKSQAMLIDDSEVESAPPTRRSKPSSQAEPPKKRTTTRGASKVPGTPAALFLDLDSDDIDAAKILDDDEGATLDDDFDAGQTLQSSAEIAGPARRSSRMPTATAARKRTAPIIVDDDSDDGAVFTGFGKKKARR
ncbi:proline-rich protein [Mycena crocata]|nr:proline-rich protein [Mycena crocata]